MNNSTLRPQPHLPFKSGLEAQEMGRKGGLVKSARKSLSMKLRWMKRKLDAADKNGTKSQLIEEHIEWLYDFMTNDELAAFEILKFIRETMSQSKNVPDKTKMAQLLIELYKLRHGTKEKNEQTFNFNNVKNYKFVIENMEVKDGAVSGDKVAANKEAEISVGLLTGQNND